MTTFNVGDQVGKFYTSPSCLNNFPNNPFKVSVVKEVKKSFVVLDDATKWCTRSGKSYPQNDNPFVTIRVLTVNDIENVRCEMIYNKINNAYEQLQRVVSSVSCDNLQRLKDLLGEILFEVGES